MKNKTEVEIKLGNFLDARLAIWDMSEPCYIYSAFAFLDAWYAAECISPEVGTEFLKKIDEKMKLYPSTYDKYCDRVEEYCSRSGSCSGLY